MRFYFLMLLLVNIHFSIESSSAVTPGLWKNHGARLGDHLRLYFISKWVAYKHNLPYLHKPFPKSEQFDLHYLEKPYN